jgi:hypothetical protein
MRRNLALLRAFRELERRRVTVGAIAGVIVEAEIGAAVIAARPGPVAIVAALVGAAVLFAAITFGVAAILRPRRVSRALDLYRWVERRDRARWRAATDEERPSMPSAARSWLEAHPASGGSADLPRIDLLMWIGEFDAARRVVDALPTEAAEERFERASVGRRRFRRERRRRTDGSSTRLAEPPTLHARGRGGWRSRRLGDAATAHAVTGRPSRAAVRAHDAGLSIEGHLLPDSPDVSPGCSCSGPRARSPPSSWQRSSSAAERRPPPRADAPTPTPIARRRPLPANKHAAPAKRRRRYSA